MSRIISLWATVIGLALLLISLTPAPATPNDFFEGKTIRLIVGFSAGGGYDMYARLFARHMPKYIAGRPTIIVQNMPGMDSSLFMPMVASKKPKRPLINPRIRENSVDTIAAVIAAN